MLGKIKKFYEENCLLDQKFIKDDKVTIAQLIAEEAKKAGCSVELKAFCFYVMGQGLEKKSEDPAGRSRQAGRGDEEVGDSRISFAARNKFRER